MTLNYSAFICPFESIEVWIGRENLQEIEYLENEKSFFGEIKNIFYSFEGLSFDKKLDKK